MDNNLIVIKLGGHAMDDPALLDAFMADVGELAQMGQQFVIVHGGGPHINDLLKRLGVESAFVNGLRVTTPAVLEGVELALCAKVNKDLTRQLQKQGLRAVGISGQDGPLLAAKPKSADLGLVGEIVRVEPRLVTTLLAAGFTPVIAPVAVDSQHQPLNVNADTAAGAIAGALHARLFVLLSDVPGVLDSDKRLLRRLDHAEIVALRVSGVISGGMLPKVECCELALQAGCQKALILDGRQKNSLKRVVEGGDVPGTEICSTIA